MMLGTPFPRRWWAVATVAAGLVVTSACSSADRALDVDVYVDPLGRSLDADQDGIVDQDEERIGTDPDRPDSDHDGVDDGEELLAGIDPRRGDTDNDSVLDGDELDLGIDPTEPDTDGGGAWDGEELLAGTDPADGEDDPPSAGAFVGGGGCTAATRALVLVPLALARRRVRR